MVRACSRTRRGSATYRTLRMERLDLRSRYEHADEAVAHLSERSLEHFVNWLNRFWIPVWAEV